MKNYYEDAQPGAEPARPVEEESSDSQVAELPKAVLCGKDYKPGDTVSMEITQVNENSVLVRCVSGESESSEMEPEPEPEAPEATPPSGMAAMME